MEKVIEVGGWIVQRGAIVGKVVAHLGHFASVDTIVSKVFKERLKLFSLRKSERYIS